MPGPRCIIPCFALYCLIAVAASQDLVPGFYPAKCPANAQAVADDYQSTIRCGWFLAPEDRQSPEKGRWVRLFVLRIESQAGRHNEPLLHFAGGPGDAASDDLGFWLDSGFHQEYDIILVDQRGMGLSLPTLDCPEHDSNDRWIALCRARLVKEGIDLSAYNSMSIVWDMNGILDALELEKVNLYGASFGSRLALLLADVAPERVRSIVLDGVYPPSRSDIVDLATNAAAALERLFSDCETAPACHATFPQLRFKFYRVVADMNREPRELGVFSDETSFLMDGNEFLLWTLSMLRHPGAVPILPLLIENFSLGRYDKLLEAMALARMPYWNEEDMHSEGAYYSVRCSEDLTLAVAEHWQAAHQQIRREIANALSQVAQDHVADCELWNVRPAPARVARVVTSDVPALLLSGAYDPATPPHWAEFAAASLGLNWHYVFPAASHGVLESEPCAKRLVQDFLADPSVRPANDCIGSLRPPNFKTWELVDS